MGVNVPESVSVPVESLQCVRDAPPRTVVSTGARRLTSSVADTAPGPASAADSTDINGTSGVGASGPVHTSLQRSSDASVGSLSAPSAAPHRAVDIIGSDIVPVATPNCGFPAACSGPPGTPPRSPTSVPPRTPTHTPARTPAVAAEATTEAIVAVSTGNDDDGVCNDVRPVSSRSSHSDASGVHRVVNGDLFDHPIDEPGPGTVTAPASPTGGQIAVTIMSPTALVDGGAGEAVDDSTPFVPDRCRRCVFVGACVPCPGRQREGRCLCVDGGRAGLSESRSFSAVFVCASMRSWLFSGCDRVA